MNKEKEILEKRNALIKTATTIVSSLFSVGLATIILFDTR